MDFTELIYLVEVLIYKEILMEEMKKEKDIIRELEKKESKAVLLISGTHSRSPLHVCSRFANPISLR